MGVTLLLFIGRQFILPEVLVRDAFTSFLAIIGLVTVSHLIAFATMVTLYLVHRPADAVGAGALVHPAVVWGGDDAPQLSGWSDAGVVVGDADA